SKHGHSFKDGILRLSLIRSSYDPDPFPEIGRHQIKLALMPFNGDLAVSDAIREGINFNHQPEIISTGTHSGKLPKSLSFIKIDSLSVVLSAIKFSEDSNKKIILRLFNPDNRETTARLSISKQIGKFKRISECDILERQIKNSSNSLAIKENTITLNLKANSIMSYILELDN
ncbi:MAG TPA: glycosyl hydrolase-related protein, partial [Victivallales bacterium]|nr:glycosyl hydrolase-related protein [Victivallales bacterium]